MEFKGCKGFTELCSFFLLDRYGRFNKADLKEVGKSEVEWIELVFDIGIGAIDTVVLGDEYPIIGDSEARKDVASYFCIVDLYMGTPFQNF